MKNYNCSNFFARSDQFFLLGQFCRSSPSSGSRAQTSMINSMLTLLDLSCIGRTSNRFIENRFIENQTFESLNPDFVCYELLFILIFFPYLDKSNKLAAWEYFQIVFKQTYNVFCELPISWIRSIRRLVDNISWR